VSFVIVCHINRQTGAGARLHCRRRARVATAWRAVATAMRDADEQYGYFDETIGASARGTIDDMLTEAEPRVCLPEEVADGNWSADTGGRSAC
jgi:hypothetical protein